ncbi:uncharacterized protein MONOS_17929 [Monocercomonoides exilis]|uniref:uncharacterized protein n=1 Tax=Monocercomonoides exilis TaxID=2049356 RepID=UPI00355A71A9|nr:hypothetical protein MONOS_17929 [Monocercomonoides exilis]
MGPSVSEFINESSGKLRVERFFELISGLRNFNNTDQKVIIKELELVMKAMDKNELEGALTVGVFELMIFEEMSKKEGKSERLLIDLCECYYLLSDDNINEKMAPSITSCLLKVASNEERSINIQKEVEMALLALSEGSRGTLVKGSQPLEEMIDIIYHHNDHRNLTQLAFQSAWRFMINNWHRNSNSQIVVVASMIFLTVVKRELKELIKCVDWKREDEGREKIRSEPKATQMIIRWLDVLGNFFIMCDKWDDDFNEVVRFVVELFRTARDNEQEISEMCTHALKMLARSKNSSVDIFEKCGVSEMISQEINCRDSNDKITENCTVILLLISAKSKDKADNDTKVEKSEDGSKEDN